MPKQREVEPAADTAKPQPPTPQSATPQPPIQASSDDSTLTNKALTVAAVGVAAALIEVELIPGMLLGVAAMLVPNLLPRIGNGLRPLIKGTIRAGYSVAERAKETVAEAGEQFQDIVAEVKAEQHSTGTGSLNGSTTTASSPEPA